jgi:uncharacterized protein YfaQ (DUF2300 family)
LWRNPENPRIVMWRAFDTAGQPIDDAAIDDASIHAPPAAPNANPSAVGPNAAPFTRQTPLGSLWKLFVHAWLIETRHPAPDYTCTGAPKLRKEELYCCDPGHAIDRDTALVRSCGLFFDPVRLGIAPSAWGAFWRAQPGAPSWLTNLDTMKPETRVSPADMLHALETVPARAREEAMKVLLARVLADAPGLVPTELVRGMGGQLRIKTFSWHLPDAARTPYGGGAGWLADGSALWFGGRGTGQQVMARHGKTLTETLPTVQPSLTPGCVKVNFFARYPFTVEQRGGQPARDGILRGAYVARFGKRLAIPFSANGELTLSSTPAGARIGGRFGIDDYVARVVDREGDATETHAARALSVIIRSYLLNEARQEGNCLIIDDSSRHQRVSINPPSTAARKVAAFTTGLILDGGPVGYHSETPSPERMAWKSAVAASRAGKPWDTILREALPAHSLAAIFDPAGVSCPRFVAAESWLAARTPRWHRFLHENLPGFEPPPPPQICVLPRGAPFSEQDRNRIFLRELKTAEDRITLAHEYLHLGLRHHPSGHDEALIEHWARRLIGEINEYSME